MLRRVRAIESFAGMLLLIVFVWLVATVPVAAVLGAIVGQATSEDNQYGRVDIPATRVMHLPSGSYEATVALLLPSRLPGHQTPSFPLPTNLSLSVTPVGVGVGGHPTISRDVGSSHAASGDYQDAQIRVWDISVPQPGQYRVSTAGDFLGIGFNPQVWFGTQGFFTGVHIWIVALLITAIPAVFFIARTAIRKRRQSAAHSE